MEKPSILIVEEQAIIAADLASKLKSMGFEVIGTALDTKTAVEMAHKMCPQVAILDINMAGEFNGVHAAKVIQELCDNMPVLFLSCGPDAINMVEQMALSGPYTCVQLPFIGEDIINAIMSLIDRDGPYVSCQLQEQ